MPSPLRPRWLLPLGLLLLAGFLFFTRLGAVGLFDADERAITKARLLPAPDNKIVPVDATWPRVTTGQAPVNGPLNTFLVAGQCGYNTDGEKLAIASSKLERKWTSFTVCDAKTDQLGLFASPSYGIPGPLNRAAMRSA